MIFINEINITQSLLESINSIFSNLLSSIDNNIYLILDDLLFIDVGTLINNNLFSLLGSSYSTGILVVCNALVYGFLIYYGFSFLLSHLLLFQIQRPSQFVFKLILCVIALNSSKLICYSLIFSTSYITSLIHSIGKSVFELDISFSTLIEQLNSTIYLGSNNLNLFSFDGLIKSFLSLGLINLALSYSLRYILIKVFILICPFAILSLSINNFSWLFKSWFKTFLSLLFLQIFVSFILLVSFSLEFSESDIFSKIIYMGSIYALIKANSFLKELMGGFSTDINFGISTIKSLFLGGG